MTFKNQQSKIALAFCLSGLLLQAYAATPATSPAKANQSWRCTDASGHVTYSQQPCAADDAELMKVADARSAAQFRQSRDNNLRDLKLARQMQRERQHEERVASRKGAGSLSGRQRRPHIIESKPNDHRPVPVTDRTRPVKVKPSAQGGKGSGSPGTQGTTINQ
ncbi:MAG: DUF4124 domain-containing protein [Burkholderiales bacterium]|jgi:hypothetical protein|nr:MAG: DUF4124 domain-containing protein [Burkholderiales bacterium]